MLVFLGYVVFAAFVILSLLTGVMAEHMTNLREMQEEDEKAEQRLKQQEAERTFFEAFKRLDTSMDRKISRSEFVDMLRDEELLQKLDDICVNLRESYANADDLFNLIDLDHDELINWSEFKFGMHELR